MGNNHISKQIFFSEPVQGSQIFPRKRHKDNLKNLKHSHIIPTYYTYYDTDNMKVQLQYEMQVNVVSKVVHE